MLFTLPQCGTKRAKFNIYFITPKTRGYETTRVLVTYLGKQYFGIKLSFNPVSVAVAEQIFSLVRIVCV
jgi:hypothetical protein